MIYIIVLRNKSLLLEIHIPWNNYYFNIWTSHQLTNQNIHNSWFYVEYGNCLWYHVQIIIQQRRYMIFLMFLIHIFFFFLNFNITKLHFTIKLTTDFFSKKKWLIIFHKQNIFFFLKVWIEAIFRFSPDFNE